MKKILTIILLIVAVSFSYSQESKAYLGIGVGYAMPGGEEGDYMENGIDLQLVNFGYRFTYTWGLTVNLTSSGHVDEDVEDWVYGIGVLSAGPMISFPVGNMTWDLKPQYVINMAGKADYGGGIEDETWKGNGFLIGNSLVFGDGGKGFTWSVNLDYLMGKFNEVEYEGETYDLSDDLEFNKFSVGVGVRYNF